MVKKKKTFETSLIELEDIVEQLESNELDLDRSLELFERGTLLYKDCKRELEKVEKKVAKLSENLQEGPLEDDSS